MINIIIWIRDTGCYTFVVGEDGDPKMLPASARASHSCSTYIG
jgi:hypothetical protein